MPVKLWQLNVFVNRPTITPELASELVAHGNKLSKPLVLPAHLGDNEPFELDEADWHKDVDSQPEGCTRDIAHCDLGGGGGVTGTWLRLPSGEVLLRTGSGWGLRFSAKFLAETLLKVHAPQKTLSFVGNTASPGTKPFAPPPPALVAAPLLPTTVDGMPLSQYQASYTCTPSELCNNFHDRELAGA